MSWAHPTYGLQYPQKDTVGVGLERLMAGLGQGLGTAGVGILGEATGLKDWLFRRGLNRKLYEQQETEWNKARLEDLIRKQMGTSAGLPEYTETTKEMPNPDYGESLTPAEGPEDAVGVSDATYGLAQKYAQPPTIKSTERKQDPYATWANKLRFMPKEVAEMGKKVVEERLKPPSGLSLEDRLRLLETGAGYKAEQERVKEKGRETRSIRADQSRQRMLALQEKLGTGRLTQTGKYQTALLGLMQQKVDAAGIRDEWQRQAAFDQLDLNIANLERQITADEVSANQKEGEMRLRTAELIKSALDGLMPQLLPYLGELDAYRRYGVIPMKFIEEYGRALKGQEGKTTLDKLYDILLGGGLQSQTPTPTAPPPSQPLPQPQGMPQSSPSGARELLDQLRRARESRPGATPGRVPQILQPPQPTQVPQLPTQGPTPGVNPGEITVDPERIRALEELIRQLEQKQQGLP